MADEEKNLIEILEDNIIIDTNKFINYVQSPHCGAIATFAGTTRVTFEGKDVLELRYEAYVLMAMLCIESIFSSSRSSWSLNAIVVAHQLGPVPVGETSVFIAISTSNRADALDACQFVYDEVKASVPIWKKEVYTDGEDWKENSESWRGGTGLGSPAWVSAVRRKFWWKRALRKGVVVPGRWR
ncbi:molybdopterin synthase catalytic subunit [Phtheirospermum japonicum]|uniref:Molybdopterin synthase catalytic subunit n=1 Tax=Phtheirospermum japonicum TaxID=374723 RepID=A0A830CJL6_9LAMI|nr:molybdopterin synthase catalytic subunit [Phtheirospermum japonicum]